MPRDKSGIQSMFNRGSGRIYQLPDWIRASSDYESKVDNFTGGSNFINQIYECIKNDGNRWCPWLLDI